MDRTAGAIGRCQELAIQATARSASWWRRAMHARAGEATGLVSGRRLMVVAAHPDDETLGCGGVIARARSDGNPVTVVVATDGRHSTRSAVVAAPALAQLRTAELRTACASLGVPESSVVALGWEDGSLRLRVPQLAARLADLLAERRPEVVLVPSGQDDHPDHCALHAAAVRAISTMSAPYLVLRYPIWAWANGPWFLDAPAGRRAALLGWAACQLAGRNWVRVACGPHMSTKRAALAAYASQLTNLTGEQSWSHLPAEFVSLFLQPYEMFQAKFVYPRTVRRVLWNPR